MALRHLGCHMEIIVKFSVALTCVKSPVSRTSWPIFGHDARGKRFSAHVGEGKVERIGDGRCGNDKGMESASGEDDKLVERG